MNIPLPGKFWLATLLAGTSAVAVALTLAMPGWIETAFGVEPDGGDGSAELGLTLVFVLLTAAFVAIAGRVWQGRARDTVISRTELGQLELVDRGAD